MVHHLNSHYCMGLYACLPISKDPLLRIRKLYVCCSDFCTGICVCVCVCVCVCAKRRHGFSSAWCPLQHLSVCVCICTRVCVSVSHPRVKHLSGVRLSPNSCEQRQTARL